MVTVGRCSEEFDFASSSQAATLLDPEIFSHLSFLLENMSRKKPIPPFFLLPPE